MFNIINIELIDNQPVNICTLNNQNYIPISDRFQIDFEDRIGPIRNKTNQLEYNSPNK